MTAIRRLTHPADQKMRGFTLIELMITLAILAIVLFVGIPSFQTMIRNGQLTADINQTLGMIAFARSEAAKRPATTITVCASSTTTATTPTCNTSNWEAGWLIMSDVNANRVLDVGDELLRIGLPMTNGNTLRTSGFASTAFIQFNAAGVPDSSGTFTLCDPRGASMAKALVLSVVGQSRLAVDEDADGIVNNHTGANVSCP